MSGPNIHVDPAALRAAATAFDAQSSHVGTLIAQFTAPARAVDGAFGLLGPSDEVERQHNQAVTSALDGLERLQQVLSGAASRLRTGAANYEAADHPIPGA